MRRLLILPVVIIFGTLVSGCFMDQSENIISDEIVSEANPEIVENLNFVLNDICNDLVIPCSEIYNNQIDRQSPAGIQKIDAKVIKVSGNRETTNMIEAYFLAKNWVVDVYNMADGIQGTLVGYTKENMSCSVLGTWELDEEYIPTGKGEVNISCFNK